MPMPLTILTPTGGRPEAFSLLEKLVARQTYVGELQWLIADDCDPPTPCTLGQTIVRPTPLWSPGDNTQCRNLMALLPLVRHPKILILEDDDYIAPRYLERMSQYLDSAPLVGEVNAHYYNVATRTYRVIHNLRHASLCQTALRVEVLPALASICQRGVPWIDLELWRSWRGDCELVPPPSSDGIPLCVGIKGMPGRAGIGIGHQDRFPGTSDQDGSVLRGWIGQDADLYAGYYRNGDGSGTVKTLS